MLNKKMAYLFAALVMAFGIGLALVVVRAEVEPAATSSANSTDTSTSGTAGGSVVNETGEPNLIQGLTTVGNEGGGVGGLVMSGMSGTVTAIDGTAITIKVGSDGAVSDLKVGDKVTLFNNSIKPVANEIKPVEQATAETKTETTTQAKPEIKSEVKNESIQALFNKIGSVLKSIFSKKK